MKTKFEWEMLFKNDWRAKCLPQNVAGAGVRLNVNTGKWNYEITHYADSAYTTRRCLRGYKNKDRAIAACEKYYRESLAPYLTKGALKWA